MGIMGQCQALRENSRTSGWSAWVKCIVAEFPVHCMEFMALLLYQLVRIITLSILLCQSLLVLFISACMLTPGSTARASQPSSIGQWTAHCMTVFFLLDCDRGCILQLGLSMEAIYNIDCMPARPVVCVYSAN